MLERMMEMAKGRGECLYIGFIDMEKAYDRVNRKKFFEVMRSNMAYMRSWSGQLKEYNDNDNVFILHNHI